MVPTLLETGQIREGDWQPSPVSKNGIGESSCVVPSNDPWERTIESVVALRKMGNDWDGQSASAISPDLLGSAVALANLLRDRKNLPAPSRVVPGPEGTVIFEWQDPDGAYCEIEVTRPFFAEVMLIEPGKPARHWTLPADQVAAHVTEPANDAHGR